MSGRNPRVYYDLSRTRKILVSFAPETFDTGEQTAHEWSKAFADALKSQQDIEIVLQNQNPGYHHDDNRCAQRENSGSTDFIVIFTMFYHSNTPDNLNEALKNYEAMPDSEDKFRMWIIQYDRKDHTSWSKYRKDFWHVLGGTGVAVVGGDSEGLRRVKIKGDVKDADGGWMDDLQNVAAAVQIHSSCKHPLPACPKHKITHQIKPNLFQKLVQQIRPGPSTKT